MNSTRLLSGAPCGLSSFMNNIDSSPQFRLLYDGLCPICSREIKKLKQMDHDNQLALIDITDPQFDPSPWGLKIEDVHQQLHLIRPDGTIVTAMNAVREMYRAIGKGWLMSWTGWPVLRPIFDLLYRIFARYRLKLSKADCKDHTCSR